MLYRLAEQRLAPGFSSIAMLGVALAMLAGSAFTGLVGTRSGGVLTLVLGTWSYLNYLSVPGPEGVEGYGFIAGLVLALLCYAASERACIHWERRRGRPLASARMLRTAIVAVAAVTGLVGLWRWAPERYLSLWWLAHAIGAMILGVVFWERRYRWAALIIYIVFIVGRVFMYDLANLALIPKFLSIAALTVPGLLISWGYSEYRSRYLRRLRALQATQQRLGDSAAQDAAQS
jgi:hypothetical protein